MKITVTDNEKMVLFEPKRGRSDETMSVDNQKIQPKGKKSGKLVTDTVFTYTNAELES